MLKNVKNSYTEDAVYECLGSVDKNNVPSCLARIIAVHIWNSDPLFQGWGHLTPKEVNWLAQIRAKINSLYLSNESGFVY